LQVNKVFFVVFSLYSHESALLLFLWGPWPGPRYTISITAQCMIFYYLYNPPNPLLTFPTLLFPYLMIPSDPNSWYISTLITRLRQCPIQLEVFSILSYIFQFCYVTLLYAFESSQSFECHELSSLCCLTKFYLI
jgi:hypothetical protein